MLTIGIPTYNRKHLLELMASSFYESNISIPHNIRIYDDCSTEYGIEELKKIFPTAASIKINSVNLRSDKNIYQMYSDFLSTTDQLLFNADSDLIFSKNWLTTALKLFERTKGILTIFNANSHESYQNIDDELCLKKTIGSAGTLFHRDIVSELITKMNSIDNIKAFDWQFSKYFENTGIPIFCVNNSLVQHIGYVGQNTKYYFDFGRNFKIETSKQGQIINDIFENFIDDIRKLETERENINHINDKKNESFLYHFRQCFVTILRKILPKKTFEKIRIKYI